MGGELAYRRALGRVTYSRGMSTIPEPEQAPPWRPEHGPQPTVWTWPPGDRPGLRIWANGAWRYAAVTARHDYEDGRVAYHVLIDVDGSTSIKHRAYWWRPEDGRMKPLHGTRGAKPSTGRSGGYGDMPRAPRRSVRPLAPARESARRPPPA